MRISILLFCLLQAVTMSAQDSEFTINGKFTTNYYDGLKIYLNEIDYADTNAVTAKDSVLIKGDTFTFRGTLDKTIAIRYITLEENEQVSALVVLEPGAIELTMSEIPSIKGTVKNDELNDFTEKQLKGRQELEKILENAQTMHQTGNLDDAKSDALEASFNEQKNLMQQDVYDFVSKNILNEVGEFFFTIYAPNLRSPQLERLYESSSAQFQESFLVKSHMNQYVWSLGDLREGAKLKGIELKNQEGALEDISVHFNKGNVVLVDFWASWCGPCIKSMPIIVKLYDRYSDSGFEIVGISLDDDASSWKSAIKRLNMQWPQYIDDGGWRGAAAQQYDITRIPQTFLLDREGKIAGHDLSGVELIEKIEELLTTKKEL